MSLKVEEIVDVTHADSTSSFIDIPGEIESIDFSPKQQKQIRKKLDQRLLMNLGLAYCVSLVDRNNVGVAAISGMNRDLQIGTGEQYSIITLAFFATYIPFQFLGPYLCRHLGPRHYIGLITLLWGIVQIGTGFSPTWQVVAGLRTLLGVFEAGFFPASVYLLSTWYTRYEIGRRYAVFYMLYCIVSALSGVTVFGIVHMNGLGGLAGWRWTFVIEGLLTCIAAAQAWLLLVPFPDARPWTARGFLTESETGWVVRRVHADRGDVLPDAFSLRASLRGAADPKVWGFALCFACTTTVTYALTYFLPIMLRKSLGFTTGQSLLLGAPPYAFAAVWMFLCGWYGDRHRSRGPVIVLNAVLEIIGLVLMACTYAVASRYVGVFLVCAGSSCNIAAVLSYQANNIRGQWKRAFCSASLAGFGGIGGIIGSVVFRSQDAPDYLPGLYACMACAGLTIIIVGLLTWHFSVANAKADRGDVKLEWVEGTEADFRYTY